MGLLQNRTAAREWYEFVAPVYDAVVATTFWPDRLQRRLLDRLPLSADDHVLDVGCGTGATSARLADSVARVTAVDHSPEQLRRARHGDAGAHLLRADAQRLPVADGAVDAVVSVGAVIYFPEPAAALAEAHRVTRPGGRLLVAGFNRPPPSWNPVENWATATNEALFFTWDGEQAREVARATGWRAVETDVTGPAWHPRLARVVTAEKETASARPRRRPRYSPTTNCSG